MNGHDGAAARRERQHVVRLVQQMHALAREAERNPELLAERIRPRRLGDRPEVRPELAGDLHVVGPAEHDVLGLLIERARPRRMLRM